MYLVIGLIVGLVIGVSIGYISNKRVKPSGTFVIDVSDPMKDICRFEMDESLDAIYSKKQIMLNVKTYAEISPK